MPRQTKAQIFRQIADGNPILWEKLASDAIATTPIGLNIKELYGFSWSTVRNNCVERGYYTPRRKPHTAQKRSSSTTYPRRPRKTKVWFWKQSATPDQWAKLVKDAEQTKPIGRDISVKYGFSWSSVRRDCVARGLYKPRRKCHQI